MLIVYSIEWRWSCTGISDVWENPTCLSDLFSWQCLMWPSRVTYTVKLFDRLWCGLTVFATVWRISNRFEFCCATLRLCSSLKRLWTCLRAVVPQSPVHHWFSYRSHLLFKMSDTTANKEFWREFVQLYRSLPELWTVKSDVHKNSSLKDAGYDELVEKLREIEDDADRDMVRKKINGLRTACRRELKKITDSTKSGIGTDDNYVSSLWYFDDSDFLRHHEIQVAGKSTKEVDICQETEFGQTYRIVYGHSLLLYNTLLRIFVWPCMGPFILKFLFLYCISYSFSILGWGLGFSSPRHDAFSGCWLRRRRDMRIPANIDLLS